MKIKISLLVLVSILILNISLSNAFYYDQSSLREEITDISIHMFLEEGSYHLVIDNTGYVSGEYDREETFVVLEIFALDGIPEYVTDSNTLPSRYYWDIPINTDTFLIFTIHFVFNITATKPVTVFLTDDQGFQDFEEEVENFDFTKPSRFLIGLGIVLGIIAVIGIVALFFDSLTKKSSEEEGAKTEVEEGKPAKLERITEVFYFCEQCNADFTSVSKTCPNCGTKLRKIKRKLQEI